MEQNLQNSLKYSVALYGNPTTTTQSSPSGEHVQDFKASDDAHHAVSSINQVAIKCSAHEEREEKEETETSCVGIKRMRETASVCSAGSNRSASSLRYVRRCLTNIRRQRSPDRDPRNPDATLLVAVHMSPGSMRISHCGKGVVDIIRTFMEVPCAPKHICRHYFESALHKYLRGEFGGNRAEVSRRFTILVSTKKQIMTASVEVVTLLGVCVVIYDCDDAVEATSACRRESSEDSNSDDDMEIKSEAVQRALQINPSSLTHEDMQKARMLITIFTQRLHQLGYCPAAANFKKGPCCAMNGEYADLRKCCISAAKRQLPLLIKTYGMPEVLSV